MTKKKTKITQDPRNARTHSDKNKAAIRASLEKLGTGRSVVVDADNVLIAGNGVWEQAEALGIPHRVIETDGSELVVIKRTDLSPDDDRRAALALADNRTTDMSEFNLPELGELLDDLPDDLQDIMAFTPAELREIFPPETPDEDTTPEPPAEPKTELGRMYQLGPHRIACGDSTDEAVVKRLLDGEKVGLIFTSPPYAQQRDYNEKIEDWDGLMRGVFSNSKLAGTDDVQILVNLGLIHKDGEWMPYWEGWIEWMRSEGWRRFGWYVWDQGSGMRGDWNGRMAPSHEWVFHFNAESVKPEKWEESIHAGEKGGTLRNPDGKIRDVTSDIVQPFKFSDSVVRVNRQSGGIPGHPAPFPVGLPTYFMNSWRSDVYDPFLGSGTTLIAAHQLGRTCYGCEISPAYVDVIVQRYCNLTDQDAGKVFDSGVAD